MKLIRQASLVLAICMLIATQKCNASEIGFSFGTSYRSSDVADHLSILGYDNGYEILLDQETGLSEDVFPNLDIGTPFGHRASAAYLSMVLVNTLPGNNFEFEHNLFASLGSQESVRKNSLGYTAGLNYIFPWYPEIMLWKMKPFAGAGVGYSLLFSENKQFKYDSNLGSEGELQFNFGGGVKIHVHKQWWLRLTVRDAIAPFMKRLKHQRLEIPVEPDNPDNLFFLMQNDFYAVKRSAHHISVFFSLVKTDFSLDGTDY